MTPDEASERLNKGAEPQVRVNWREEWQQAIQLGIEALELFSELRRTALCPRLSSYREDIVNRLKSLLPSETE